MRTGVTLTHLLSHSAGFPSDTIGFCGVTTQWTAPGLFLNHPETRCGLRRALSTTTLTPVLALGGHRSRGLPPGLPTAVYDMLRTGPSPRPKPHALGHVQCRQSRRKWPTRDRLPARPRRSNHTAEQLTELDCPTASTGGACCNCHRTTRHFAQMLLQEAAAIH